MIEILKESITNKLRHTFREDCKRNYKFNKILKTHYRIDKSFSEFKYKDH